MQRIYVYVKYNPEWQNLKFKSTNNKKKNEWENPEDFVYWEQKSS